MKGFESDDLERRGNEVVESERIVGKGSDDSVFSRCDRGAVSKHGLCSKERETSLHQEEQHEERFATKFSTTQEAQHLHFPMRTLANIQKPVAYTSCVVL